MNYSKWQLLAGIFSSKLDYTLIERIISYQLKNHYRNCFHFKNISEAFGCVLNTYKKCRQDLISFPSKINLEHV